MDSYFIDPQRRRAVKVLFINHPLSVNSECYGLRNQLKYNVVVEKMDLVNLIVGYSEPDRFTDKYNGTFFPLPANSLDRMQ